jgi:hypothetical protein
MTSAGREGKDTQHDPLLAPHGAILHNEHINGMAFNNVKFRGDMREIEGTYKVRVDNWIREGYKFRIRLIWDYNRLWGTFELHAAIRGILVIDPGPDQSHFQAVDEYDHRHRDHHKSKDGQVRPDTTVREYQFFWREGNMMPPIPFPFAHGVIRFGNREIWGCFLEMGVAGLPAGYCYFHGRKPCGPADVPPIWNIQDFVNEWNSYHRWYNSQVRPSRIRGTHKTKHNEARISPTIFTKLDAEDRNLRQKFLLRLKGFFDITESAAEIRGKSKGQVGTISFEVDANRIFGQFNFCMVQATMHMSQLLENYVLEDPVQFTWSGIEGVTRRSVDGSGALVFSTTRTSLESSVR